MRFLNHVETQGTQQIVAGQIISLVEQTQADSAESLLVINRALRDLENANCQLTTYAASKPGRDDLNHVEASIGSVNGALHSLRALTDKKATLEDLQRSLDEVRGSLQMLQTAKAELRDVDNIKIELNNAAMALDGLQVAKADQSSIDEAHREIAQVLDTKADRASLDDARHLLSRALETKADRFEITALTNYFISLLQTRVTKDEIAPLEESHYALIQHTDSDRAAAEAANCKFRASLEAVQTDAKRNLDESLRVVNLALDSLIQSKVDRGLLDNVRTELTTTFAAALSSLNETVTGLSLNKADRAAIEATQDIKRNLLDQERRLALLLEEARKRLPEPISTTQVQTMLAEDDHLLDAMYASLEDTFRGTSADIKQRQTVYLPYIRGVKAGEPSSPVVDLGCGRGEWLDFYAKVDSLPVGWT